MSDSRRVLLALLALTLLSTPVGLLTSALLPDVTKSPVTVYLTTIVQELVMFLLPAVVLRVRRTERDNIARGWLWLLIAAALGAAAYYTGAVLDGWWKAFTGLPARWLPEADGMLERVLQITALAVVPAIAEEAFFRGALLTALRRESQPVMAVVLTTLLFALLHGSASGLATHLFISLVLTLLMWYSGNLALPVLAHLVYNLMAMFGAPHGTMLGVGCGAGLCIFFVMLLRGRMRAGENVLGRGERRLVLLILLMMTARYFL